MSLLLFLLFVGAYAVGSIPTAYLVVKRRSNVDIRNAGSGNVGGFNAAQVTDSKLVGIFVGILDGIKGLFVVLLAAYVAPDRFWVAAIALLSAVVGHNYSLWLKFKGGRGLATAAGGMFLIGFSYTIIWCTLWAIAKVAKRDILTSNLIAIFLTPVVVNVLPWGVVNKVNLVNVDPASFLLFSCVLSVQLIVSHFDAVKQAWRSLAIKKTSGSG